MLTQISMGNQKMITELFVSASKIVKFNKFCKTRVGGSLNGYSHIFWSQKWEEIISPFLKYYYLK